MVESERNASKGATQAALEGWSTQELPPVRATGPADQTNEPPCKSSAEACSPAKPRPLRLLPD